MRNESGAIPAARSYRSSASARMKFDPATNRVRTASPWWFVLALALAAPLAVRANPGLAPPVGEARELVEETTVRVLDAIDRERDSIEQSRQRLYELVDQIVLEHFDFRLMSIRVLGKNWRKATGEQRKQFVREFKKLLVRTYATALEEYSGQEIRYLPVRSRKDRTDVTVRTMVAQDGAPPISIQYALRWKDERWKVFDVAVEGVSLVINYRASFQSEIRQQGIPGLIARLEERNGWERRQQTERWD